MMHPASEIYLLTSYLFKKVHIQYRKQNRFFALATPGNVLPFFVPFCIWLLMTIIFEVPNFSILLISYVQVYTTYNVMGLQIEPVLK